MSRGNSSERTLNVSVQLSLRVQVFKALEEFPHDDGDILFAEYSRFHLKGPIEMSAGSVFKEGIAHQIRA